MSGREEIVALNTDFDTMRSERDSLKQNNTYKPKFNDQELPKSGSKRKQQRRELVSSGNNETRKGHPSNERVVDSDYDTALSRGLMNRKSSRVAVI